MDVRVNNFNGLQAEKVRRVSRSLRHIQILNPSRGPDWGLFSFCFKGRWQGHPPFGDWALDAEWVWIGPPPTLSNQPPPQELDQMLHIACKFDVAGRDERNRALGRAGEERVLAHERAALRTAGRDDLARKVRWVSEEDGDGAGYDIASFAPDGLPRLIEVKTTNG
jgi:hypothetical protein